MPELDTLLFGTTVELGGLPRYLGITVGVLDYLPVLNGVAPQKERRPRGK
ncbi:MAG: hypothetical protein HYY65_08845 [Candidatus Tectomicrobia bacterium]|uniref:Uncharacterized protein n=1 Tax=Tectimicrobiota bacterium TaxID=2528274 RepID=A0A932GPU8_UNCTE|nr:hypothetical protein [Candidatus Tectomicrobia bacterium]